jgi:transcriptional regulator with XRE-family HTH domain
MMRERRDKAAIERLRERLAHAEDGWLFAQIADQLSEQRRARGLSQAQVAKLGGTAQSAMPRLEAGGRPPRIDTLLRLANALDCELVVQLRPRASTKDGPSA